MPQQFSKPVFYSSVAAIVIGFIFLANGLILAWTGPTAPPPSSNTPTPLNISNTAQTKAGDLRLDGRNRVYFGAGEQFLYGNNNATLYYDSNHDTVTQMIFRDKQNTAYGRIYGSGDGAYFGLLDGDGNWSYLASKDSYTEFRIDDSGKMRIRADGDVAIGGTLEAASNLKLDVEGRVGATEYCDENGQNCIIPDSELPVVRLATVARAAGDGHVAQGQNQSPIPIVCDICQSNRVIIPENGTYELELNLYSVSGTHPGWWTIYRNGAEIAPGTGAGTNVLGTGS